MAKAKPILGTGGGGGTFPPHTPGTLERTLPLQRPNTPTPQHSNSSLSTPRRPQ